MEETQFLKCLIDDNRRAILRLLQEGERPVGEIAEQLGMEQSLCSHHLARLRTCGLVVPEQRGRSVVYRIVDPSISEVLSRIKEVSGCIEKDGGDACE